MGYKANMYVALFCERKCSNIAIRSWKRANRSRRTLKKTNGSRSHGNDLLLGIKRGKAVKNFKNKVKNTILFAIERVNHEQINHVALFKVRQEQFAHGRKFFKERRE